MDKVQKYNSFNTTTPSSESYRNYSYITVARRATYLSSLLVPSCERLKLTAKEEGEAKHRCGH
jgi:hypothetical protein